MTGGRLTMAGFEDEPEVDRIPAEDATTISELVDLYRAAQRTHSGG